MIKKELVQVPVIKGQGSKQFFINKTIILPNDYPVYKIHSEDFQIKISEKDLKIIPGNPGKVIFNGKVIKNVIYKVVEIDPEYVVFGDMRHATAEYEISGFIDLEETGEKVLATDIPEILSAVVEGYSEELEGEKTGPCETTVYEKIHEKIVVKVDLKVTRMEHLVIEVEEYKKEEEKED